MASALALLLSTVAYAAPATAPTAAAQPATEAPAQTTTEAPAQPAAATDSDPFDEVQLDPRPKTGPAPQPAPYSLELSEAEIERPEATYKLTARRWRQMVREDPELWHLHKRGRLVVPGAIFLSISGVWLSISTAVYLDSRGSEWYSPTATEKLFQWGFPAALLVSGAVMTVIGARARSELRQRQHALYVAPYASAGTSGLTLTGRF